MCPLVLIHMGCFFKYTYIIKHVSCLPQVIVVLVVEDVVAKNTHVLRVMEDVPTTTNVSVPLSVTVIVKATIKRHAATDTVCVYFLRHLSINNWG